MHTAGQPLSVGKRSPPADAMPARFDLTRLPAVSVLLRNRWPQVIASALALAGLTFAIVSGLFGAPVGSRNFAIVFVWIGWWALLMLIAVPLAGRGWCSLCPIPAPGEWLQRGAVLGPHRRSPLGEGRGLGLGRRWPRRLRNIWAQNAAFALVALFSLPVLTQPRVTAWVLLGMLLLATGASLIYERRAFCRYLCPVGGFIGLFSKLAPLELRVRDPRLCAGHTRKTCYTGDTTGYGCPWQVYPGSLRQNTNCGLCFECLRTCPYDNVALNLRPFGADLTGAGAPGPDEAFKAFLMLGSAIAYSAVMLGPWGALKSAAYAVGTAGWGAWALAFLAFVFGVLPGLFRLSLAAGQAAKARSRSAFTPAGRRFSAFSAALLPLGLAAWIAFSLSFVSANLSYLWPALSDPMGWGWDLFGTAALGWRPFTGSALPWAQTAVLLGGFAWSCAVAGRVAEHRAGSGRGAGAQAVAVMAYCLAATVVLLWLLVG